MRLLLVPLERSRSEVLRTDSEERYACSLYGYGSVESGFLFWNP